MLKVEIKTPGKEGSVDFPTSAHEVKFSNFIKFEAEYERKEDFLKEAKEKGLEVTDSEYKLRYFLHVSRCVAAFCGDTEILNLPAGDYIDSITRFFGAKEVDKIDIDEAENSIFILYAQVWETLGNYKRLVLDKPNDDFIFEYKNETYYLPKYRRDIVNNTLHFDHITTGQAVEALEAVRVWNHYKEQDKDLKFMYTAVLNLIACFATRKKDKFPTKDIDIQKWISSRVSHFQGVNMEIALNAKDFFLLGTINYKKMAALNSFLSLQETRLLAKTRQLIE